MNDSITIASTFAGELRSNYALSGAASPEDQLKGPVPTIIKALGATLGYDVKTQTEAHVSAEKVRPDIAVYVRPPRKHAHLINGYVELKQPGLGAEPRQFARDRDGHGGGRLAGSVELAVAGAQPLLSLLSGIAERLGQGLLPEQLVTADPCREAIAPGSLYQQSRGDSTSMPATSAQASHMGNAG